MRILLRLGAIELTRLPATARLPVQARAAGPARASQLRLPDSPSVPAPIQMPGMGPACSVAVQVFLPPMGPPGVPSPKGPGGPPQPSVPSPSVDVPSLPKLKTRSTPVTVTMPPTTATWRAILSQRTVILGPVDMNLQVAERSSSCLACCSPSHS
jgi:hypothetical protein